MSSLEKNIVNSGLNEKEEKKEGSQIETDKHILDFLGDIKIEKPEDIFKLRAHIHNYLEFKEINEENKEYEEAIRWKRTASEIIQDGYVYEGTSCSDLTVIFIASCKALGIENNFVKLVNLPKNNTHSVAEVKIDDKWWRLDPSINNDLVFFEGEFLKDKVYDKNWEGGWKVWKKGKDLWDLGLQGIEDEEKVYE